MRDILSFSELGNAPSKGNWFPCSTGDIASQIWSITSKPTWPKSRSNRFPSSWLIERKW